MVFSAYVPTYYDRDDTVVVMLELLGHVLLDLMQFVVNAQSRFMQVANIRVLWSKHTDPGCTVNKLLVRLRTARACWRRYLGTCEYSIILHCQVAAGASSL